jgi:hypothetical protein
VISTDKSMLVVVFRVKAGADDGMTLSTEEDAIADHDLCIEHVKDLGSGGIGVVDLCS